MSEATPVGSSRTNRKPAIARVSRAEPCCICGKPNWCSRAGRLHLCARTHGEEISGFIFEGLTENGVSGKYRENGHQSGGPNSDRGRCGGCGGSDEEVEEDNTTPNLDPIHATCVGALIDDRKGALAKRLGLPVHALDVLEIGWWADRDAWLRDEEPPRWAGRPGCWTFPERDREGQLIGLNLRFPFTDQSGRTARSHLGKRGLTLPAGWQDLPEPIVCVEGPTDVIAGRLIGVSCIGRPFNSGGADQIADACRGRKLILLGENDQKSDGRWPGRDGVKTLARKLAQLLGRPPHQAFPPDDQKDLRSWVLHRLSQPAPDDGEVSRDE